MSDEKALLLTPSDRTSGGGGGGRYDGVDGSIQQDGPLIRRAVSRPPPLSDEINVGVSNGHGVRHPPNLVQQNSGSNARPGSQSPRSLTSSLSYSYGPVFQKYTGHPDAPSQKWQSLDVYQSLAGVARHPTLAHEGYYQDHNCCFMLWRMTEATLLLAITGFLTALVTIFVNLTVYHFNPIRFLIISLLDEKSHILAGMTFTLYVICMSLMSAVVTNNICPEAVGGGIPDVKTVLSGLISQPIVSIRLVFAKALGLIFALIAGLSVGKEGPFVHISVAISDTLMRMHCFRHCRRNISKRLEILGCACAAGVASTFGTPFGGVLFSIEVTATYYMVRNLPRAFFCAVCAAMVYEFLGLRDTFSLFTDSHSTVEGYDPIDLLLCSLLGVICGLAGTIFVSAISTVSRARNRYLKSSLGWDVVSKRRVLLVGVAAALVAPLAYLDIAYGIHGGDKPLTDYMFTMGPVGVGAPLIIYVVFKFIVTTICVSLPLPVGLFTPTFVTGGAIGRLFGEFINAYTKTDEGSFEPWEYAVIGAAAFSSGVTRAVSTAVIVFELSGQSHLRLPISVALLVAYFVANRFTKNVYEEILDTNGTPSLPELPAELYMISAAQVMRPIEELPYLTVDSTFADAEAILMRGSADWLIPVVDSKSSMALQGAVLVEDLKTSLNTLYEQLAEEALADRADIESRGSSHPGGSAGAAGIMTAEGKRVSWAGGNKSTPNKAMASARRAALFEDEDLDGTPGGSRLQSGSSPATTASPAATDRSWGGQNNNSNNRPSSIRQGKPLTTGDIPINFVVLRNQDTAISLTPISRPKRNLSGMLYVTRPEVIMDPSPYQIADGTLLSKVDFSFRMLRVTQAYVVGSGRLVGVLTRDRLTEFVGTREKKPMDRCMQLMTSCMDFFCCRPHRSHPRSPVVREAV